MAWPHPRTARPLFFLAAIACASVLAQTPVEREQGFEALIPGPGFPALDWVCWGEYGDHRTPDCGEEPGWVMFPEDGAFGHLASVPYIHTVRAWKDFDARWEFRSGGFGSFHYRIQPDEGPPMWVMGYAMGIDELRDGPPGTDWDLYRSKPDTLRHRPVDGWHAARVVVDGDSIEHWLNGEKVVGYRIGSADYRAHLKMSSRFRHPHFNNTLPVDSVHPLMRAGPIGWAGMGGGSLRIRNFRIADLPLRPASRVRSPAPKAKPSKRLTAPGRDWADSEGSHRDTRGRLLAPSLQNP